MIEKYRNDLLSSVNRGQYFLPRSSKPFKPPLVWRSPCDKSLSFAGKTSIQPKSSYKKNKINKKINKRSRSAPAAISFACILKKEEEEKKVDKPKGRRGKQEK